MKKEFWSDMAGGGGMLFWMFGLHIWSDMAGLGIMLLVMLGAAALRAYIWL